MMKRLIITTLVSALLLAGCAGQEDTNTSAPTPIRTADSTGPSATEGAAPLLARYGLQEMDTVEVIDHLDRLGGDGRPTDLMASVRPDELQMTAGAEQVRLPIPEDRFYLSVAPYVDRTHDCYYHSLTTCQGELTEKDVHVKIVDTSTGKVIVEETRTTFANGFVGFWLPRNTRGTLQVGYDGKVGRTKFSTDSKAPTCLTTLKLT